MTADEIDALMKVTLENGFPVHCLYNQETDEHPQRYFSRQLAVGDPETLTHVVRSALEKTKVDFS